MDTLLWHDYETTGANPRADRPSQFAAQRTDLKLNPIGEPISLYCQPHPDRLPSPGAVLITHITPQLALARGLPEQEFIARIEAAFRERNSCGVGYNSLRFDDEVTRHTLWRNFRDPYAREWGEGRSRWDIIDLVRACYALRPDGIEWPTKEDGSPSFRLEDLATANGLEQERAHDALSDVQATIALARLLREKQPALFDYAFKLRRKQAVLKQLDLVDRKPFVHVSGMYAAEHCRMSVVMPLAQNPGNKNGVFVYDLRVDPTPFLDMDPETLAYRQFTPSDQLGDDEPRLPVKTIHVNRCPFVAPMSTLKDADTERCQIDMDQCMAHRDIVLAHPQFAANVLLAHGSPPSPPSDPDIALYGGFLGEDDRRRLGEVRAADASTLAGLSPVFDDKRLPELFQRYKARNFPEILSEMELGQWRDHCAEQLRSSGDSGNLTLAAYLAEIEQLQQAQPESAELLGQLIEWGQGLALELGVST